MASCHTHAAYQGVQLSQLHQPSCHCIFPQNSQNFLAEENFCVFCVFRGTILRNLNICVHLCHLWEDYLGLPHAPTQGVQLSQLHQPSKKCTNQAATASSHRIHRTHRSLLLKCTPTEFTEFSCRGELLCILRVPWDNTTQPKHLWASVLSVGGLFRATTRTHPGGAAVSAAPTEQPLHLPTEFTEHTETSC